MIQYTASLDGIGPENLQGFFVGWPNPPSPETHLKILRSSSAVELAVNSKTGNVVGFVTAISDGILSAYLPLLEVLPEYQKRGVGSELMQRIMKRFDRFYMVDLVCDETLQPYYARLGMRPAPAMTVRRFEFQSGIVR